MEMEKKSGSAGASEVRSCFEGARKPQANDAKLDLKSRFGNDVCVEIFFFSRPRQLILSNHLYFRSTYIISTSL